MTIAHRPSQENAEGDLAIKYSLTREISMPSFRQARGADSSLEADMMSTFGLGQMLVRRSGHGAMHFAGPYAFGPPPDRAPAIGGVQAARTPRPPAQQPGGDRRRAVPPACA